jgi:hypothetical protein
MTSSMTPSPSVLPGRAKTVITQRAALISTLRTWFLYRDEVLWAFGSGTEGDHPLEEIKIDEGAAAHIAEAKEAGKRAWAIAEKIARENEQKASSVMRDAINELLATEAPSFRVAYSRLILTFVYFLRVKR